MVIETAGGACEKLFRICQSTETKSSTFGNIYFPRFTLAKGHYWSLPVEERKLFVDHWWVVTIFEVTWLKQMTAKKVIHHTIGIFAWHGICEVVICAQYSADAYGRFAKEYQFQHIMSSLYCPHSNGEVERAVGTIKHLLNNPYLAILSYRSTPLQNGYTP